MRSIANAGGLLQVSVDGETSQTIISGMGELHLEVYVERMRREYDVNAHTILALPCPVCCDVPL